MSNDVLYNAKPLLGSYMETIKLFETMSASFVLITGMPGTGKTTIVKRLIEELFITSNYSVAGFYTEEVRNIHGNRIGFDVVSLDATNRGVLARNDQTTGTSKHKVVNYSVDTSSLDNFLRPIYEYRSPTDILVIDEIGKMELKSSFFHKFISQMISTSDKDKFNHKIVIATVPIVKTIPIVEQIKSVRNGKLFTVTKLNRNGIYDEIKKTVADRLSVS